MGTTYLGQVRQEVEGRTAHERERGGQMVVLHRRGVVELQRDLVAAVYEKVVGAAAVLKVVDCLEKRARQSVIKVRTGGRGRKSMQIDRKKEGTKKRVKREKRGN